MPTANSKQDTPGVNGLKVVLMSAGALFDYYGTTNDNQTYELLGKSLKLLHLLLHQERLEQNSGAGDPRTVAILAFLSEVAPDRFRPFVDFAAHGSAFSGDVNINEFCRSIAGWYDRTASIGLTKDDTSGFTEWLNLPTVFRLTLEHLVGRWYVPEVGKSRMRGEWLVYRLNKTLYTDTTFYSGDFANRADTFELALLGGELWYGSLSCSTGFPGSCKLVGNTLFLTYHEMRVGHEMESIWNLEALSGKYDRFRVHFELNIRWADEWGRGYSTTTSEFDMYRL